MTAKLIIRISVLWLGITLTACTTILPENNYYLLNGANTATQTPPANAKLLLVKPVQLAEFLNKKYLVLQKGNKIQFAQTHQWAQPLAASTTTALTHELNNTLSQWRVSQSQFNLAERNAVELTVIINRFHATDTASIVLEGSYQLRRAGKLMLEDYFHSQQDIEQDGFEASVIQMRQMLSAVANNIASKVEQT